MFEKLHVYQFKKLDEVQKSYQDWRKALHLTEFENRYDFFQGFKRELIELEDELKFEKKNRLNIAGEAADILLYAIGMLDQEDSRFSSLLSNGEKITFFEELQQVTKKRLKDNNWHSSREIVDKIKKDTDAIDQVIELNQEDIKPKLKEIVLDSASLITLLGLPIGKIINSKLARNENKYRREEFSEESLGSETSLGQLGLTLPLLVHLRHSQLKHQWDKSLDEEYIKASLGSMAGIFLIGTAALHSIKEFSVNLYTHVNRPLTEKIAPH